MDLSIGQMMQMQRDLYAPHEGKWHPMEPDLLYMVEEMGEVIAILKKKGSAAVMDDENVRSAFLEEMADVLMYYNDVLLRYHVSAEEISESYRRKFEKNMNRDYTKEYKEVGHYE